MPYSQVVIPSDGVTTLLTVNLALGYLPSTETVRVRAGNEVDGSNNPVYRAYTWVTPTQMQVSGSAPPEGQSWLIERISPKDQLIVNFADGDPIIAKNLDDAQKQAIHIAHEALDLGTRAVKVAPGKVGPIMDQLEDGDTLMVGPNNTIVAGPNAEEIQSAQEYAEQALASKTAAEAAQVAASASASTAASSASSANTSAIAAASSAASAGTSATNAATSASAANTSATNASNSATAAAGSATSASNSATAASTSAGTASTAATNASNSATAAAGSASAASTSASNAATSATNAANSATAASAYRAFANAVQLGMVPNNTSVDNGPLLAAAWAACAAAGYSLYIPRGVYYGNSFDITASMDIVGGGRESTVLRRTPNSTTRNNSALSLMSGDNWNLESITIDCNTPNMGSAMGGMYATVGMSNFRMKDVEVKNTTGTAVDFNNGGNYQHWNAEVDLKVFNAGWSGIRFHGFKRSTLKGWVYSSGFNGIEVEDCSACRVIAWVNKETPWDKSAGYLINSTSTTSTTIGTGSKTFTLASNSGFKLYQLVWVRDVSNKDTNWMRGKITAFSYPSMTVTVDTISGSGTIANWEIRAEEGMLLWRGVRNNRVIYDSPILINNYNAREDGLGIGEVGQESTSSVTVGTGSKSFTIGSGLDYRVGDNVYIWSTNSVSGSPIGMYANVTSYSGTTLTVNVWAVTGSGTYTNWQLNIIGGQENIISPYIYRAGLFGLDVQSNNNIVGGCIEEAYERGLELGYDLGGKLENAVITGITIKNTGSFDTVFDAAGVFLGNGSRQYFRNITLNGIKVVDDRPTKHQGYGIISNSGPKLVIYEAFEIDTSCDFWGAGTGPLYFFGANGAPNAQGYVIPYTPTLAWTGAAPTGATLTGSYEWVGRKRIKVSFTLFTGTTGASSIATGSLPIQARAGQPGTALAAGATGGAATQINGYIDGGGTAAVFYGSGGVFGNNQTLYFTGEYDIIGS